MPDAIDSMRFELVEIRSNKIGQDWLGYESMDHATTLTSFISRFVWLEFQPYCLGSAWLCLTESVWLPWDPDGVG